MSRRKELQNRQAELRAAWDKLHATAENEKRGLNDAEIVEDDKFATEAEEIRVELAREERKLAAIKAMPAPPSTIATIEGYDARLREFRERGPDQLLAAIPVRMRAMIPILESRALYEDALPYARRLKRDPIRAAAMCAWLKNAAKLQLSQFAAQHATIAAELEALTFALNGGYQAAAMQEDTAAEGGLTVPSPLEGEILRAILDQAVVRPLVRTVTMTAKTLSWPGGDNAITAAIIAEEGSITESNETFTARQLVAKKFAAFGTASMELIEDAAVSILDHYLTVGGERIGLLEDDQALEGDGTHFTGISAVSGTGAVAAGGTNATLAAEIGKVKFAGPQGSRRGASWVMNSQTAGHLVGVSDSNGKPLLNTEDIGRVISAGVGAGVGLGEGTILGNPVFTSDEIAVTAATPDTANVYYGNFRGGLIYGDRTGVDFMVSPHVAFQTAQLKLRIIKRTAILVGVPSYFTKWTAVPSE